MKGIIRNIKMNKTLLSIIPATVKVAKLLTVLCIFTGFQAYAAPITTIGNLSYDGTLITGDGRTYVGLDTLAPLTYQQTLDKIADDPIYAEYRIADNEDADFFLNSLFGNLSDACSARDRQHGERHCGYVPGWNDGAFGDTETNWRFDYFFFVASDSPDQEAGFVSIDDDDNEVIQDEDWVSFSDTDSYSSNVSAADHRSWLLVSDSNANIAVPTPSSFAIFVLGLAGIRFARRRRS
jgi:hypothetical protein